MYGTKSLGNATYEGVRTVEESTTSVGLSVYGMEILGNATYERVVRTVEESTTSVGLSVYGTEILGNATYARNFLETRRTNG